MGKLGTASIALASGLIIMAAVISWRTATFKAPTAVDPKSVRLAPARPVDSLKAAGHLGEAVRFKTVSHQIAADNNYAEWARLERWLVSTYPAAHAVMQREVVADHALIYTWQGTDPSLKPIILMAHQDVVPVTSGTEGQWKHAPFGGEFADQAVWGRGSIDDKGSLVSLFEAIDALASAGFKPRRTVILASGHDEEAGGRGAVAIAARLKSQGIRAQFVLDEGMAVLTENPLTGKPSALIGIAEKGYATLKMVARAPGGHSSTPPSDTGVATLAHGIIAITSQPFPMTFSGPAAQMTQALAPEASWKVRVAIANSWLFEPLLVHQAAASAAGASMLHTTIAPTMLKGSPKENVLPQDATAWINYRIQPGHSATAIMEHSRRVLGKLPISLSWEGTPREPSPVSSTTSEAWRELATLAADESGAPVAPALVTAGTDSRSLSGIADDVYRFQPLRASLDETRMIHGTNEHMSLENLTRMVRFYQRLIETAAG